MERFETTYNNDEHVKSFINESEYLELDTKSLFRKGYVCVNIKSLEKPKKIINELVELVKSSELAEQELSLVHVNNCQPKLVVSYSKNVVFWQESNCSGTRIPRKSVTDYITSKCVN